MNIASLCKRPIVVIEAHATLRDAARLMREQHVGALVVTVAQEAGREVALGIVTDRDLAIEVLSRDLAPGEVNVGALAKRELVSVPGSQGVSEAVSFSRNRDHPLRPAARSAHRLSRRRRFERGRRPRGRHRGRRRWPLPGSRASCRRPPRTARTPSPVFALLSEMRMLQERGAQPVVGMHRRVFTESRRARLYAGDVPGTLLPTPRDYEWLELTRAWREGHDGETWFVADPRRTDLALIDRGPRAARARTGGRSTAPSTSAAVRPDELDWHIVSEPGWFLEQGWALTPETAGIAERDGWGPHRRPSIGWVRRRADGRRS